MCRSGPWPRRQSRPWAAPTGKRRIHRSYPMSRKLTTPAAVAASLVALMVAAPAGAADYVQAAGSTLAFATTYDGEVVTGTFPGFSTPPTFDPADLSASTLDVTIPDRTRLVSGQSVSVRFYLGSLPTLHTIQQYSYHHTHALTN